MVDADMKAAGLEPIGDADKILSSEFPNRWWNAD
jgi:GDPmannose 4,6-dehydratase